MDEEDVGRLLHSAAARVGGALAAVLVEHGLTPRGWRVLRAAAAGPRAQRALAACTGLDTTSMVTTIDDLEKAGFVRRECCVGDRRVKLVVLTERGGEVLAAGDRSARWAEDAALAPLDAPERGELMRLLRRLVEGESGVRAGGSPGNLAGRPAASDLHCAGPREGVAAMAVNPIQLQKFLGGVDYPASRDQLVDHAQGKGADDDVLDTLRAIEDREYDGPNAVSAAVSDAS